MKGVIFRELLGYLEIEGGPRLVEDVLSAASFEHGGAYTAIGRYPWQDAGELIALASERLGERAETLCRAFGKHLFGRFTVLYSDVVGAYADAETLLHHVEDHIHRDVRTLYPDASPPRVAARTEDGRLIVEYTSHRPFAAMAHGLIEGAMAHFGDRRELVWLSGAADGREAVFAIEGGSG